MTNTGHLDAGPRFSPIDACPLPSKKVWEGRLSSSAVIQIIDVILWLFARSLKEEIPQNFQGLLDYVYSRAYMEDFSFPNAEEMAEAMLDKLFSTEMSP